MLRNLPSSTVLLYAIAGMMIFIMLRRLLNARKKAMRAIQRTYQVDELAEAVLQKPQEDSLRSLKRPYWVNHRVVSSNPNFGTPAAPDWPVTPEMQNERLYLAQLNLHVAKFEQDDQPEQQ